MSEEMKNAALAFCRGCLGWCDAKMGFHGFEGQGDEDFIHSEIYRDTLPYRDVGSVLWRAKSWLDSDQKLSLDLTEYGVAESIVLDGEVLSYIGLQSTESDAICLAVFQACVAANRKLLAWDAKAASKTTTHA